MPGSLEGIRVVDVTRVMAGPLCAMILGDLGADVIKVERPGSGDDTRQWGPPWAGDESAYYLCLNRNKRGLTADLKTAAGVEIVRRLAQSSDVFIQNFTPGVLSEYGLSHEELSAENPALIYCSITGYGCTGPDADQPGYDFAIQGRGGIMSVTGEPEGPPMRVGVPIVDVTAAMNGAIAILAALQARHVTGRGQFIDISLLDSQVAWLVNRGSAYLVGDVVPRRWGNADPNIVPYEVFKAKDKWFTLAVGNDAQFARFAQLIGAPNLARDSRFSTNLARVEHREELADLLATFLQERTAAEWLAVFRREKIPGGPINDIPDVFSDPQVRARDMVVEMPHPTAGRVRLAGSPLKLSDNPVTYRRHPPLLGEHTAEVMRELGYSDEEIERLRAEGVV